MMSREVDAYINEQKSPQKQILKKVRKIFLKTLRRCDEEMKWGVPVYAGGKFYIAALKKQVNVGFAISGLTKAEIDSFEGGGKTMRHIKIHSLENIDERELVRLIKMVNKKAVCKQC